MPQSYRIAQGIAITTQIAFVHLVDFHSPKDTLFDFTFLIFVRQAQVAFSESTIVPTVS